MTNNAENQSKHCHNNHCPNRDVCHWANDWLAGQEIFFGDEKDCQDFVSKDNDCKTHPKTA